MGTRELLTALNDLALVEQKRGKLPAAVALFGEVLAGFERLEGVEMEKALTRWRLSEALRESDPARSLSLVEEALVSGAACGCPTLTTSCSIF